MLTKQIVLGFLTTFFALSATFAAGTEKSKPQKTIPELFKIARSAVGTVLATEYKRRSKITHQGSGFFVSPDGHFVTNHHVIPDNVYAAKIKLHKGSEYPIKEVLARDEEKDLLLVAVDIPADSVRYLEVSAAVPEIGEDILVVGSPQGLDQTATRGIISSVRRDSTYGKVIQIDAPISPGSSGSPVLGMGGTVVGVATFKKDGENLNFAIPGASLIDLMQAISESSSLAEYGDPFDDLMMVKAGVQEMMTLEVGTLDSHQVAVISHIFEVPGENISRFRWGPSVAAPPDRLAGSIWYTIWYEQDEQKLSSTVRIDSTGSVIE